jgi:hypothetical protein
MGENDRNGAWHQIDQTNEMEPGTKSIIGTEKLI